uniref:LOW QUALITY PROTEIN: FH2 domain-containing protein 1-like n=1 Tax=Monopterus albus TaxID=43700 RepID=UPI0009B38241|nr:LOW QUALITY PROTEIN: FH2 domain-containing protein 1-like [Monopterus albus]
MGSISPANEREGFSIQEEGVAVPTSPSSTSIFSDIEGNQTRPSRPVPPPPLPPLLPPPPLPPPLLPGLGDPAGGDLRKKVRRFFWKTIPEEQVKGRDNVWTQGQAQQHYQIDVQTVEELFGQNDSQSDSTPTRGGKLRSSFRETREEVSILDTKRGMNIGIFLKQFKRSNQTLVDDIRSGNSEPYGAEPLRELLKMLPETEEVKKLAAYRGDVSKLSLADSFMYQLIQLPSYTVRIESMLLKEEFPGACEAIKRDIHTLRSATRELMCCEELHAVLHLVLQAGNILNAGGYAGNAVGFKLSSLLSLADTRANKPGMNLLHFVALEVQKKGKKLLEFPVKLTHVPAAARISLEMLDGELQWMMTRTRSLEDSVQTDTVLLQQLDDFLQCATSSLCSLRDERQQLKKEGSELIDFFCEDRETFRLDDCFSIFHTFCSKFTNAVKENMEREAKEAARCRRVQEMEEKKRHSWAGGEKVGGAFKLRYVAATSQLNEAGLLMELLTFNSCPRSSLNSSQSSLGRSGSLRRFRNTPSSSPFIAAERELSMFLASPDRKVIQKRGRADARTVFSSASPESGLRSLELSPQTGPQSPRVRMLGFTENQQPQIDQMEPQAPSSPPKTSCNPKNTNSDHTTTTYLRCDATQTPVDTVNTTVKPTSDSNQQFGHNNNSSKDPQFGIWGETTGTNEADQDSSDEKLEPSTPTLGKMSVVIKTCTLIRELRVFSNIPSKEHHTGHQQDDMAITDVEEDRVDKSRVEKEQNNPQTGNAQGSETYPSSSPREEEDRQEEKVVVWCVTGVCEAAAEFTHADNTHTEAEKDQCCSDNQGGNQQASSSPAHCTPSEPQPANEKPVPVPISSQPVPVSRCDDLSIQGSSHRWFPAEPLSASEAPALTTDASEEDKESASQGGEPEGSTNENRDVETVPEKSTDKSSKNKTASCHTNGKTASYTNAKPELATSTQPSTKYLPNSKPQATSTPNTSPSNANKSKSVQTLTTFEKEDLRRVVSVSRTRRGTPSLEKCPEKPSGVRRGSTPTSLNRSSIRRGERPSTAPSSRRSSINKTPDPKDSKVQKVSGTQTPAREQGLQRKPSIRKTLAKPKPQPEERMCRATLRALGQAGDGGGGGGGGGSVSAPATPLHKATTPSSPLPGFARNTAASSFRKNHTTLSPPHSPHTGSYSSPKSPPKTTSSPISPRGTSPFTRTGSQRMSGTSRLSDVLSRTPVKMSPNIRSPPCSPLHDSLTPPKAPRQNDSGSFPEKSAHSRDLDKGTRPSWR